MQSRESEEGQLVGNICQPPVLRAAQTPPTPTSGTTSEVCGEGEGRGGFNYRASMDNLVIRTFQFPVR